MELNPQDYQSLRPIAMHLENYINLLNEEKAKVARLEQELIEAKKEIIQLKEKINSNNFDSKVFIGRRPIGKD
jgi:uncharacterized protein (UPF0335 family)